MALSSSSTDTEVLAQYDDNARYWESSTKANNLLEAIIVMTGRLPQSQSIAGRSFTKQSLEDLRKEVSKYVKPTFSPSASPFVRGKPV